MKKKILVVDDNRLMLHYMVDLLEKQGHAVLTAEDGISALDILNSFTPDVIFVDLVMPKIDGERLCRIIRTRPQLMDCFIVILSAAVTEIAFDHKKVGANVCIAKGPMNAMAGHVLSALEMADGKGSAVFDGILGLDGVYPRQMTKELLIRNQYLETILGSIAEGVLEIYSGRVVYTNAAAEHLFNRSQEEILNAYPPDLFGPKEFSRIADLLTQVAKEPVEIGIHNPLDLNNRLVSVKCIPINSEASSLMMLVTDVTRRRQMELKLQQANKMEAIGTIAGGIAHNFRNTLAGILTNSQVLQMFYKNDSKVIEVVQRINSSVRKGTVLIDGLLQFSRQQSKKQFEPVDLSDLIHEVFLLINESFGKKIIIRRNAPDALYVLGDASALRHALMNLCTNAYDAMPNGGELSIDAEACGDSAVVSISDTGSGMDQKTVEKCFDPFFTQGEIGEGTGMGLAVTYGIVKSHDGDIQVESRPGRGSVFRLRFPLIAHSEEDRIEEAAVEENGATEKRLTTGGGKKVLLVDNEKELVNALIKLLEYLEYEAVSASNGLDAIETYKTFKPDIVLMDINMPGMNGIACAEKIMEFDPRAKIAIMSGYEENYGLDESKKAMIAGYLTKPISLGDLSRFLAKTTGE